MDKILNGNVQEGISFWTIFCKTVLSKSGERCGRILGLQFSSTTITGFKIWMGFQIIEIDANLIRNLESLHSGKKILLSIDPIFLLNGKSVFDSDGKKLGKISKIMQLGNYNDFDAIIVKRKFYLPGIRVEKSQIEVMHKNIILKG
jgi:sporulation protein YlmC with PRC-barrel domain